MAQTRLAGANRGLGRGGQGMGLGAAGNVVVLSPSLSPATCEPCKAPHGLVGSSPPGTRCSWAWGSASSGNGVQHPVSTGQCSSHGHGDILMSGDAVIFLGFHHFRFHSLLLIPVLLRM